MLPSLFVAGALTWSLAEYLVHRFVLHHGPARIRAEHWKHHRDPLADTGVPYRITGSASGLAFLLGWLFFGAEGVAYAAGLVTGYFGYVLLHEGLHRWEIGKGHFLYTLKLQHDLHHRGVRGNYGVTSPLFDIAFGTFVPAR